MKSKPRESSRAISTDSFKLFLFLYKVLNSFSLSLKKNQKNLGFLSSICPKKTTTKLSLLFKKKASFSLLPLLSSPVTTLTEASRTNLLLFPFSFCLEPNNNFQQPKPTKKAAPVTFIAIRGMRDGPTFETKHVYVRVESTLYMRAASSRGLHSM